MTLRVLLLTNIPTPYRLPLFKQLSNFYDLDVFFCESGHDFRKWNTEPDRFGFRHTVLSSLVIGPLLINHTIVSHLFSGDYDVFIVGDNKRHLFATMATFLFAKATGRPFVLWTGEMNIRLKQSSDHKSIRQRFFSGCVAFVSEMYRRVLYAGADAFVAYSTNTREHLTKRGVDPDNIFIGGQVMPEECLPPKTQSSEGLNDESKNKFTITFLGYLQERKGVQFLIEAYNSLDLQGTRLQIAGSGTYQQRLKQLAADNDRIEFLGYVEDGSKARCYVESDLFVLPTLQDPWGLVINEAIHYDCPVIVTEAAGSADLVRELNCGIVVKPGDPEELRQAIRELHYDSDRRYHYIKNAQESFESTDVDIGVKPFRKAIMSVIDE